MGNNDHNIYFVAFVSQDVQYVLKYNDSQTWQASKYAHIVKDDKMDKTGI